MFFHDICGAKLENVDMLNECPECLCPLNKERISRVPDGGLIKHISSDESFMNAMVELYEKDPIEYQLKIQQFKNQLDQQEQQEQESSNVADGKPKCPYCQSTNLTKISSVRKATKIGLFGIFGAGDIGKTYKCNNCGSRF